MNTRNKGFTLVELMVAMAIGLILTLAALHVFLTNQRNFSMQHAVADLNEDGQMAVRFIAAEMRRSGFYNEATNAFQNPVDLSNNRTTNGANGGNDSITLVVPVLNNQGNRSSTDRITYSVNNGTLQRTLDGTTDDLLPGVASFQVLYGIDDQYDGQLAPTRYVTANNIGGHPIVSIRFSLLLVNDSLNHLPAASQRYWVLDEQTGQLNDNSLRRLYGTTVHIRNYDWSRVHCRPGDPDCTP